MRSFQNNFCSKKVMYTDQKNPKCLYKSCLSSWGPFVDEKWCFSLSFARSFFVIFHAENVKGPRFDNNVYSLRFWENVTMDLRAHDKSQPKMKQLLPFFRSFPRHYFVSLTFVYLPVESQYWAWSVLQILGKIKSKSIKFVKGKFGKVLIIIVVDKVIFASKIMLFSVTVFYLFTYFFRNFITACNCFSNCSFRKL